MTKALLVLSLLFLAAGLILNSGLIDVGQTDMLYAVLPVGATLFGLFLIVKGLEKESARYDEEHQEAHGSTERPAANPGTARATSGGNPTTASEESAVHRP